MNTSSQAPIDIAFQGLMRRYSERVPDVQRVVDCMIREGIIRSWEDIENDHVAFRTMGVPQLGFNRLKKSSSSSDTNAAMLIASSPKN